jgi:hypothetical protein
VEKTDAMLKFIVISKRRVELAIARERAENRRRPRFQSHSWHGSPSPASSTTAEEVNIKFPSSFLVSKLRLLFYLLFGIYFIYNVFFDVIEAVLASCLAYSSTLKMEAVLSSETLVNYLTTQCQFPGGLVTRFVFPQPY